MKVHQDDNYYFIFCPGCNTKHLIPKEPSQNGAKWEFNDDFEKPTFSPSVKLSWEQPSQYDENDIPIDSIAHICHFNITNGQIIIHGDSTHSSVGAGSFPLTDLVSDGLSCD